MSLAKTLSNCAPDRFTDLEPVGRGAQGEVWRARATRGPSPVAIKRFAAGAASVYFRELRLLLDLRHPHVARLLDFFDAGDCHLLVFEFCSGGSLKQELDSPREWNLREVLDLALQMLEALAWLHARGLIHGDVKPANILRARATGAVHWKLTDFGIAGATLDGARALGFTPEYAAPEAKRGLRHLNSDVYSFGRTLLECLGRVAPLARREPAWGRLNELARHCMEIIPQDRPASAGCLREARRIDAELRASLYTNLDLQDPIPLPTFRGELPA